MGDVLPFNSHSRVEPTSELTFNCVFHPVQKVDTPETVIIGIVGIALTVTCVPAEVVLHVDAVTFTAYKPVALAV